MPILKEKARENLESAILLKENNKLSSSIHCYYYTCLQISKHILCNNCNIAYEKQQEEVDSRKGNTHNYLINELFEKIKNRNNSRFDALKYQDNINNLKFLRKKADYNNEKIVSDNVEESERLCKKILEIINNQFGVNYEC